LNIEFSFSFESFHQYQIERKCSISNLIFQIVMHYQPNSFSCQRCGYSQPMATIPCQRVCLFNCSTSLSIRFICPFHFSALISIHKLYLKDHSEGFLLDETVNKSIESRFFCSIERFSSSIVRQSIRVIDAILSQSTNRYRSIRSLGVIISIYSISNHSFIFDE
jgi:hypothetical protein